MKPDERETGEVGLTTSKEAADRAGVNWTIGHRCTQRHMHSRTGRGRVIASQVVAAALVELL